MNISMRSLVSLSLLVTTAYGPTGELPAEDVAPAAASTLDERRPQEFSLVEAARHSLLLTDQAHSELTARLGLDGLTALFADDISYSDGDRLIRGRQAAREYLAAHQYPAPAGYTMRWQAVRGDVSADGRDGYTFGWVTFTAADGSTWNLYGK